MSEAPLNQSQVTDNTEENTKSRTQVARGAAWMAAGTMTSRVLGLVRETLIVTFLPRFATDAFFVALRLPNMFRRLLGEGSLSVSFIPTYIETLSKKGEKEAAELASGVFTLLFMSVSVLTLAGIYWMEPLLNFVVSGEGYRSVPGKMELTVQLGRIVFGFIFLISLYAFFMAILQAHRIFGLPAVAPALFNVSLIVALLLPSSWSQIPGEMLAWGVIVGGGMQAGVLVPKLLRLKQFPRLTLNFWNAGVRKVLLAAGPSMAGMGILQLTGFLNLYFASRLEQGAHSYIYLADRILELPLSLFAVSLGSSLLPELSKFWADKKVDKMVESTEESLRLIFFIALPCALGMWFMAEPITSVIFGYGRFGSADVEMTAKIVQLYSFSLLIASLVRIMVPSFYAMKNTWLPALSSVLGLCLHAVLAIPLMERWGLDGLVISTILGGAFNLLIVSISFKKAFGRLPFAGFLNFMPRTLICGVGVVFVAHVHGMLNVQLSFLDLSAVSLKIIQIVLLLSMIALAALLYFVNAKALKMDEVDCLIGIFRRRRKK